MKGWRVITLLMAALFMFGIASALAASYEVYSIQYSGLKNYPADAILFSTDRGKVMDVPFSYCFIKGEGHQYMFDTGYTDVAMGVKWGAPEGAWSSIPDNLGKLGTSPDKIEAVFIGHMHWDHGGGLGELPNATFYVQKKEIEFAAGEITQKKHTMAGFDPRDVLAMVKLNWEGRVKVLDGDVPSGIAGINCYFTPGHTAGTMTVTVPSRKGTICLTGDAVYTDRNLSEMIPLGFGYNLVQMLESFDKIKKIGGMVVPGHDAGTYAGKFPKVAGNIVRID